MLNDTIRERCKQMGIKQVDVARICGVTQATVSHWFSGKTAIPLDAALKLRSHMGITLDDLCGEKYADPRMKELADSFVLLNDEGRDYLIQQARFALAMREFR